MSYNMPEISLTDIVLIKGGKRLPAGSNLQLSPSKHPYIRIRDVGQRNLPREGIEYVPDEVFPSISRYIVEENDVVLSIVGTIGALSIVDRFYNLASLTENCVKLTGLDYYDALYLFYCLSSRAGQQEISQGTVGAVQPKLPIYNIEKIRVVWPDDKDQRKKIAHILGTLDDKIENNRKTAKTLEAMAQAIFKSWFVDFDPVRAKMNGESRESICKRLKLTPEILDLFPDRLVDSELGEIPEGWEIKPLGDLLNLAYGKPLKAENRAQGSVPVYGSNGIIGWHDEKLVNGSGIVVGRKGNPGTVTWVESDFYPIDTTFYVIPKSGIRLRFLYQALMRHDLTSLGADSAVPGLNRNLAYISKQLVPHADLCTVFENLTEKLFLTRHNLMRQSSNSTDVRDSLLPKLISGEIRIPEINNKPRVLS